MATATYKIISGATTATCGSTANFTISDKCNLDPGDFIRLPTGEHLEIIEPPNPTKFWECEYCGTVNPIDLLDCRGKACGHSITKKAMQAAFGVVGKSEVVAKYAEPKLAISGPDPEIVCVDYAEPGTTSRESEYKSYLDYEAERRWPGVLETYQMYGEIDRAEMRAIWLKRYPEIGEYVDWQHGMALQNWRV